MKKRTVAVTVTVALSGFLILLAPFGGNISVKMSERDGSPHVSVSIEDLGSSPKKIADEAYALARDECVKVTKVTPPKPKPSGPRVLYSTINLNLGDITEEIRKALTSTGEWEGPCRFIVN